MVSQGGLSVCVGDARFGRASATLGGGKNKLRIDKQNFHQKVSACFGDARFGRACATLGGGKKNN